jgi:hypothetical protein
MTLAEMADHVVLFAGVDDADTKRNAKEFLKRRYKSVYDFHPWMSVHATIQLRTTTAEIILPDWVDKIVQVREDNASDARNLQMVSRQDIFLLNPGALDDTGARMAYTPLSDVAGHTHPNGNKVTIKSTSTSDTTGVVRLRGTYNGLTCEESLNLSGTSQVTSINFYDELIHGSKPVTVGSVIINTVEATPDEVGVILPDETERRHKRIQLVYDFETSDPEEVITILVKRRCTPLRHDNDTPAISNLDDALIAHAVADMLELERQFAKAQTKRQEAVGLVAQLIAAERDHQQNRQVIVPVDEAYGEQSTLY